MYTNRSVIARGKIDGPDGEWTEIDAVLCWYTGRLDMGGGPPGEVLRQFYKDPHAVGDLFEGRSLLAIGEDGYIHYSRPGQSDWEYQTHPGIEAVYDLADLYGAGYLHIYPLNSRDLSWVSYMRTEGSTEDLRWSICPGGNR